MIEVIMAVYQRPHRMPELFQQFKNQTVQSFKVNIWNNSGKKIDIADFPIERVQIVESPKNRSAGDRYKLIPLTTGNPIIILDDDMSIEPDFIEYYFEQYEKWGRKCVLGWYSKLFYGETHKNIYGEKINEKANCLAYGQEVDFIGPGGMVVDREFFTPEIINNQRYYDELQSDDIFINYMARQNGFKLVSIDKKCQIMDDHFDNRHYTRHLRKKTFLELRNKDWKFLEDKI